MELKIPEQHYQAFEKFLNLRGPSMSSFVETLCAMPPALNIRNLAAKIAQKANLGHEDTAEILRMLASLYGTVRAHPNVPESDFIEDLFRALKKTARPELQPKDENEKAELKKYISKILSCERSLGVTSKALDVMMEHMHVFQDARILTDMRPVYTSDLQKGPAAAVIVHSLKIEYLENEDRKEFFVAMDSADLQILQDVLKRASVKETSLKEIIKKAELTHLAPESPQGNV